MFSEAFDAVTLTLNPAIDRTVQIPGFTEGAVNRAGPEQRSPGGKGVNVASALAAAGHRVAVTGLLGRDNAALFEEIFDRAGIADRFVRVAGETRTGIKIVDPDRARTTEINFPGLPADPRALETLGLMLDRLDARWFVLSGSLPPGMDPRFYAGWVARLRKRGVRVALDTSGEPLRRAIEADALPDLIKPNVHELAEWLGETPRDRAAVVRAARALATRGVGLVVVSMGAEGAVFVRAGEAWGIRPPPLAVGSTVGAGDAMMAGLVSAALRNLPLEAGARLATAFAVGHLTGRRGSSSPDPRAFRAEQLA